MRAVTARVSVGWRKFVFAVRCGQKKSVKMIIYGGEMRNKKSMLQRAEFMCEVMLRDRKRTSALKLM